jgi:haloacid dehalogenase superfamily, subfamily IA, variant 3 with third motif having DD or ED/haloacid dehalogenase superfamily, subfamily IA, variant 1 with third motif having Dx(3-4)D or Dx(3-4)E
MDGLMFDTERVFIEAWDYAGEKMGIGKAGFMTRKTLGMSIVMSREIWLEEFEDKYDEVALRKHTKEFLVQYYSANKVPVKKGLYSLIGYLHNMNYKLAVATSSPKWEVESHLKDANVFDYFNVIVCGDMVSKSKPEPEIYLKACELLQEKPEDCYALEDSKNGLLAAYRAGCKAIMVPDLWQPDDEIIDCIYGKFIDLDAVKEFFVMNDSQEQAVMKKVKSKLRLVKLDAKYKLHLNDMMEEWYATGEKIIPYAIRRLDYREFDNYMNCLEVKNDKEDLVPDSTFFCLDVERNIFVGAVNIRHYLNDSLLLNGGHIGDGVRPSERRKGIATEMIRLALKECKKIGIDKVLMVCDKDNIGSAKSIQKNGGILENEVIVDGIVEQRYWISME